MTGLNNIVITGRLRDARVTRITLRQNGRYGLSTYAPRRAKDGEIIWKCIHQTAKGHDFPLNQAPKGYNLGGLHNQPLGYAKPSEIRMVK